MIKMGALLSSIADVANGAVLVEKLRDRLAVISDVGSFSGPLQFGFTAGIGGEGTRHFDLRVGLVRVSDASPHP